MQVGFVTVWNCRLSQKQLHFDHINTKISQTMWQQIKLITQFHVTSYIIISLDTVTHRSVTEVTHAGLPFFI